DGPREDELGACGCQREWQSGLCLCGRVNAKESRQRRTCGGGAPRGHGLHRHVDLRFDRFAQFAKRYGTYRRKNREEIGCFPTKPWVRLAPRSDRMKLLTPCLNVLHLLCSCRRNVTSTVCQTRTSSPTRFHRSRTSTRRHRRC